MQKRLVFLILIFVALLMISNVWLPDLSSSQVSAQATNLSDPVQTAQGPIRGEVLGDTVVFRGVPYAAPPVGALRWRPSQLPAVRSEVLDTVKFGPVCPQLAGNGINGEEDCLSLNIWAPKSKQTTLRPVMVFIHGGANVSGASSIFPLYDGQPLVEKGGVIAITINYRLGPLGFLGHPLLSAEDANNSSGNYGLLDQILALQWVQKNIGNFGGDANNVTVFGESAGGLNIVCLISSPLAKGLFAKAIVESAGQAIGPFVLNQPLRSNSTNIIEAAEDFGTRYTAALDCDGADDPIDCLRNKTALELLTSTISRDANYGPNVDGYVLLDNVLAVLKNGQQNNVPIMIGTNRNEGTMFISPTIRTEADYKASVIEMLGQEKGEKVLARYPISNYGNDPRAALDALVRDFIFLCPARVASRLMVTNQPKVYVYQFTHTIAIVKDLGAFHGLELPFVFGTADRVIPLVSRKDIKFSNKMLSYWTNFAKNGDPNGKGLAKWPVYTLNDDANIDLNPKFGTKKALEKDLCDFLSDLFDFD